jgi:two-component system NarL family response regulator
VTVTTAPIRILIVDDHSIVRDGLSLIIDREPDLEVVASAASGEEALDAFRRESPDVVLMDLQLPRMSGVEAIRAIRRTDSATPIVVLTMYEGDEDIHKALEAGATTYLLKDALSDDLVRVVRAVRAGERPIPPNVRARLEDRATKPQLTNREVEVLELVLSGQRNKEIAFSLSISEETVQVHLRRIFAKLDVHDRTAAVSLALRRGILHIR